MTNNDMIYMYLDHGEAQPGFSPVQSTEGSLCFTRTWRWY